MTLTVEQRALEKEIKKRSPGLLNGLSGDKKKQLLDLVQGTPRALESVGLVLSQTTHTSSPVPPAELLAGYNDAFTDGAHRLFSLVEAQSAHRQSLELKTVESNIALTSKGQLFAALLAVFFGGIGLYFGVIGHVALASVVFTTTIGGIVTTFVLGKQAQSQSLEKKAPKSGSQK